MPDRIQETLGALRVDADRTGLPDSGDVRRRGDRRSRNQALGSAVAVVAIIAGVIGVAGVTGALDDDRGIEGPPADDPSVSTSERPLSTIATKPFLRPTDLRFAYGVTYDEAGAKLDNEFVDAKEVPTTALMHCMSTPRDWGATELKATLYHQPWTEVTLHEWVVQFDDARAARQAIQRPGEEFADCPPVNPNDGTLEVRGPEPVDGVDAALRMSRSFAPPDAGTSYFELGLIRSENIVVVLEWSAMGNPEENAGGWAWTAERLQTALDRAVG